MLESQRQIAMITEMLHTATLVHDDVIDAADSRRGKDSVNCVWGQRKVTGFMNRTLKPPNIMLFNQPGLYAVYKHSFTFDELPTCVVQSQDLMLRSTVSSSLHI